MFPQKVILDFEEWYRSVKDDWDAISETHGRLDQQQPETDKEKLLHAARVRKVQAEYDLQAQRILAADAIHFIVDNTPAGELYVKTLDIEAHFQW